MSTTEDTETAMDHDSTATTHSVPEPAPESSPVRRVRVGTVVWGLVLAAIGVGLLATVAGLTFDTQLAFIVLVASAGVALLVGSLVTSRRRR